MSIHQLELQGVQPLDNLPLYIPRYIYKSSQQFREIFQIEYTRCENLNRASIHRYNGQEHRYNHIYHAIYPQYRDHLQALDRRYGYTCLPLTWTAFSDNTHGRSCLPRSHKSQQNHLQFLCYNPTPYFLFFIDQTRFKKEYLNLKNSARFRFFRQNTLLAMAPLPEHGFAAGKIDLEISEWIIEMNLKSRVNRWLGSGVSARDDQDEIRIPDGAYGPARPPPGFSRGRPTLVLEVGKSQSLPSLEDDAKWWLNPTKGGTGVCITCKLDQTPRLVIDVWERHALEGRGGDIGETIRVQHIIITKKKSTGDIVVRGAPMTVKFSLLMRRLPDANSSREKDLVIGVERLKEIAVDIWKEQGLLEDGD